MAYEKIVSAFDSLDKAKQASRMLQSAGFPSEEISVLDKASLTKASSDSPGFWRRMFSDNVTEGETEIYNRTVQDGGAVVSVRVPHENVPRAMEILDAHKPIDLQDRARRYGLDVSRARADATALKDNVIRLAEEQLDVGKQLFQTGTTRIRRFVVEKPVEAQVTLHEEHAEVTRRAVTEPAAMQDIDWSERTIEVNETAERPVVNKTPRIAEEIVIRRTGSDHVETIRDVVRRQQVSVDKVDLDRKKAA